MLQMLCYAWWKTTASFGLSRATLKFTLIRNIFTFGIAMSLIYSFWGKEQVKAEFGVGATFGLAIAAAFAAIYAYNLITIGIKKLRGQPVNLDYFDQRLAQPQIIQAKKTTREDLYTARLNELENAVMQYQQLSEQLLKSAKEHTIQEYTKSLHGDATFRQYINKGKDIAVLMSLRLRNTHKAINPILKQLRESHDGWNDLQAKLLRLSLEINDQNLATKIKDYSEEDLKLSNESLLINLMSTSFNASEFSYQERIDIEKDKEKKQKVKLFATYLAIMKRINSLRLRRRIHQWLKLA
jgi:hypothetical protein